ncbi:hypothetical protein CS063_12895 [Sporanaerobium hydrogeniformans]|uniref:Uncharacterized protein n=1 Tax=Sporanaerobium hydrogeniformans TaxID=3072179 RepID=A0AC61D9R2_9FIRM|nr:hypothetical protein [Sporanaerobium hydrogeniformans]PHV70036.1 hypothetical protein CS063_12895 [Sporanaerobium hydrogeniformans]
MKKVQQIIWVIMSIIILIVAIRGVSIKKQVTPIEIETDTKIEAVVENVKLPRTYNTYEAQIKFSQNLRSFEGSEIIKYVHEFQTPTTTLVLQIPSNAAISKEERDKLGYSSIDEVNIVTAMVEGKEVKFTQRGTNVTLYLEDALNYKSEVEIVLTLQGTIYRVAKDPIEQSDVILSKSFLPQLVPFEEQRGWISLPVSGQEQFAYAEPADYTVTVTSSKSVFATGSLIATQTKDNGQSYTYMAKKVRDFGICMTDPLAMQEFFLPGDKRLIIYSYTTVSLENLASKVGNIFGYYNDILGTYPYEEFTIVDIPELKTIFSYPTFMICDLSKFQTSYDESYIQIGKQWIPYILCNNPKSNGWINKGLEKYLAYRASTSIVGIKRSVSYDIKRLEESTGKSYEDEQNLDEVLRPMQMLADVEETIGTEDWYTLLRQYYKNSAFTTSTNNGLMEEIIKNYKSEPRFFSGQVEDYIVQE